MESELSLPRTVERPMLSDRCDLTRRNDLDGSGNLSEDALAEFTRFFLAVSIAQVTFMDSLMQPDRLRTRILLSAEEAIRMEQLPAQSNQHPGSGALSWRTAARGRRHRCRHRRTSDAAHYSRSRRGASPGVREATAAAPRGVFGRGHLTLHD